MKTDLIRRKTLNIWVYFYYLRLIRNPDPNPAVEKWLQNMRLRRLMKKAYQIPFYRKRFDKAGLTPADFKTAEDLRKFPILTKPELREWMSQEKEKEENKYYYHDTTSGSSGSPTMILYSPREKAWNMANWVRVLRKTGFNPFTGLTATRLSVASEVAQQKSFVQKLGILRRSFVNQYEPEEEVIRQIGEIKPGLLYMNKTELMRVAIYAQNHNIQVYQPKVFVPIGEAIDDKSREYLKKVFGNGLADSYGTVETGACMLKVPGSTKYRPHNDLFVVDVVPVDGPETHSGHIFVTALYKTDLPVINYEIGDTVYFEEENGQKVVGYVQGRTSDFIHHPNGEITTYFLLSPVIAHSEDVVQVRFIQKSYEDLTVQAVLSEKGAKKGRETVEEELRQGFLERLKQPMEITFDWMDVIPPDKNGKMRLIINEMKQ